MTCNSWIGTYVEFNEPTLIIIDYIAAPDKAAQFADAMATLDVVPYLSFLTRLSDDFPHSSGVLELLKGMLSEPFAALLYTFSGSGLIFASGISFASEVDLLLTEGIDANQRLDQDGFFPLFMAAPNGHVPAAVALISAGMEK